MWQGVLDWLRSPSDRGAVRGPDASRCADLPGEGTGAIAAEAVLRTEFAEAELLDFMAADLDPVQADPVFREQLREELWTLVQDGVARAKNH